MYHVSNIMVVTDCVRDTFFDNELELERRCTMSYLIYNVLRFPRLFSLHRPAIPYCCNFFHTSSFMQNFANPRWAPITGICFLLPIILHRLESMWLEAGYVYSNSYLFNTVKHLRPLDGLMYFAN